MPIHIVKVTTAFLLLAGVSSAGFAQSTGFITTRPVCSPNGAQDPLNYIQGPDPIQLSNGDVAILVNSGRCCTGHWEGIFSLIYPAAGRAATPRFSGIWASNNFDTEPARREAEVGFPSAIFYNGKWRVAYTSTFLPFGMTDRDRVARLDLNNLTYQVPSAQVTNQWIKPIDPACQDLGSCAGKGSGVLGTFALHPNGDLYVYHPDGNLPSCTSGWVRHKINPNMSVANAGGNGCISLNGLTAAPPWVSDIARGADGKLYMLVGSPNSIKRIDEWVSTGDASTIGLVWNTTGRTWIAPSHPNPPKVYSIWDAGYLKDQNRKLVEPKVVVAQISDGTSWAEITNVELGRWYLYYWADAGAVLPPTFGGPASSCAFGGFHDSATCQVIAGWAWDPDFPNSPISVDIFDGSTLIATVPANLYRADLQLAGKGNGIHAFSWPVPLSLRNNQAHSITVKYSGTEKRLSNSPKSLTCAPPT